MRLFRCALVYAACLCSSFFSYDALAAAYQLYELGTPVIGTAGVGQAALAADASTSFFNPAGMALLPDTQFMQGSQMLLPFVNFSKHANTTFRGDNGGNAGLLTPGLGTYFAYSYSPCLKFGISMTSPYGGSLNYSDGWVGRYLVQDVLFYTININPSVAFRFNDWLSVGAGVAVEYMNLMQTVALPLIPEDEIDGQLNIKMSSVSPGFNLGLLVTPSPATKIGLAFRSQLIHHLRGTTTFLRISNKPATRTKMVMPATLTLSAAQDLWCYGTLLGEVGWGNWSSMKRNVLNVSRFAVATTLDWNDTYRVGLGGQFKATPDLILQAGVSYDSSPTKSSRRTPNLPMDRQLRVGTGILFDMIKGVQIGASCEFIDFGNASINNVSKLGVLSGKYSKNFASTVQISVNVAT